MAISGTKWKRVQNTESPYYGQLILDSNGFPLKEDVGGDSWEVGNREPKFQGGWNNTFTFFKNWTFNMLWEFSVGGDVFNGTKYEMTMNGVSDFSGKFRQEDLTIAGVQNTGTADDPNYVEVSNTWSPNGTYTFAGKEHSGLAIIQDYYLGAYNYEVRNWITKVNSLRLRTISLTYEFPRALMARTKYIKRAAITASANNLLLFTNVQSLSCV